MSKLKEFRGEWFSPKQKEIKLPGILTINQKENDIKLVLFSETDIAGKTIFKELNNRDNYCKIILGITPKGEQITLYNHSGYEGGAPILEYHIGAKFYEAVYKPNFAFIGKHFLSPESITFNSYSFQYNFLDSWIDTTRKYFDTKYLANNDTTITIPSIPSVDIQITNDCRLSIIRGLYSNDRVFSRNYDLEIRHYVKFNFTSSTSLHKYLNLSAKFRAFLTFAVGYPVSTINEFAETDNMDSWHKDQALEIYHTYTDKEIDNRRLFSHGMFFCSQNIKHEDLIQYLSNWFNIYNTYHSAIDIFLYAVTPFWKKGNTTVSNVQFTNGLLNICQAIETFYNRDNDTNSADKLEELNSLKEKVHGKIRKNKDGLNFTNSELDYFNEHFKVPKSPKDLYYDHKIIHYLIELKQALDCFINEDEFKDFAKKLKDCRNTLTHVSHGGNIDEEYDLPYLFYYSQILFYAMITNKIGMNHKVINTVLRDSNKFSRYYKSSEEEETGTKSIHGMEIGSDLPKRPAPQPKPKSNSNSKKK